MIHKPQDFDEDALERACMELFVRKLAWRKKQQTRQAVRLCIEQELDKLPAVYERPIYERKCDLCYRHVYDC
jgi:hypothetical protein